jgi:Bacterial capsule synthesis protein PGA_cap
VHGGHEYYRYPSPRMVEQYRFYAEQGASAVICHHSHCFSGFELYRGVPIFYGLGNFLFDGQNVSPGWYTGFIVTLKPAVSKTMEWKLFPYVQSREKLRVEPMSPAEQKTFFEEIDSINRVIADPDRLAEEFNRYVMEQQKQVMAMLSTSYVFGNKYVRSAIRKLGMERFFMRQAQLKSILNYSRCEAHRDVTISVLHNYFKTK